MASSPSWQAAGKLDHFCALRTTFVCGTKKALSSCISGGGIQSSARAHILAESPSVLVVEDEFFLQADLEDALTRGGFATEVVSSGEEALALLVTERHDALVTDVRLAGAVSGWEVARQIRGKDPFFPVIYVTAYEQDWAANGVPNSVVIPKPFTSAKVVTAVWSLLNERTASNRTS